VATQTSSVAYSPLTLDPLMTINADMCTRRVMVLSY